VKSSNHFSFRGLNNGESEGKTLMANLRGEAKMKIAQIFMNQLKDASLINKDLGSSANYISPNLSDTTKRYLRTNRIVQNTGRETIDDTTYRSLMSIEEVDLESSTYVKKLPTKTGLKQVITTRTAKNVVRRVENVNVLHPFHLYKLNTTASIRSSMLLVSSHHPFDDNDHFDYVVPGLLPIESQIEDEFTSMSNGKIQQAKFVAIGNAKLAVYDQQNTSTMSEIISQLQTPNARNSLNRLFSVAHKKAMRNNQSVVEGTTNFFKMTSMEGNRRKPTYRF
jgi:hypothetical protein